MNVSGLLITEGTDLKMDLIYRGGECVPLSDAVLLQTGSRRIIPPHPLPLFLFFVLH